MLFGQWRGLQLALALATTFGLSLGLAQSAQADGQIFHHTIPRVSAAYNYSTGGEFYAPPVPYGHYAKDIHGDALRAAGCVACKLHALCGLAGCHSLFHKGCGDGGACGSGYGYGGGACNGGQGPLGTNGGIPAGANGGTSAGVNGGIPAGTYANSGTFGPGGAIAGGANSNLGLGTEYTGVVRAGGVGSLGATSVGFAATGSDPTGQINLSPYGPSSCCQPGCTIQGVHSHPGNWQGAGASGGFGPAGGGGPGYGPGGGGPGYGPGGGGPGYGPGGGAGYGPGGGTGCGFCGGKGCAKCLSAIKACCAAVHGKIASCVGALHAPKVQWFLGAGGPVPLTPGYVPYIVVTRSPRDFFAFPPMNPNDP
jgi:hypothetical protein